MANRTRVFRLALVEYGNLMENICGLNIGDNFVELKKVQKYRSYPISHIYLII